jgi:tetratricopeptide (TPR) repeat protein
MLEDVLSTFTDRQEALALFEQIRHRDLRQASWPLLPILTFLAPGGSGKSLLIERLIAGYCIRADDRRTVVPFAHIDFSQRGQPRDLLSILIELRDQLQNHADDQGRHLTFPRFDLGASFAQAFSLEGSLPDLRRDDVRTSLHAASAAFRELGEMGQALGNIVPLIPPLLVVLKWARQATQRLPGFEELLTQLEQRPAWRWYTTHEADIGLDTGPTRVEDVLARLHALSISTRAHKEGRRHLVNIVLPAAFLADLLTAPDGSAQSQTWQASTPLILFLDGFEELLDGPEPIGVHLLETLTLSTHRRQGGTDPLLLVLGSRKRVLAHLDDPLQLHAHTPDWQQQTPLQDQLMTTEWAADYLARWRGQLPAATHHLRLNHLYLPLWLQDFGLADASNYLAKIGARELANPFQDTHLQQAMHRATHGHPLYLALAAAAVVEARANRHILNPRVFEEAPVPAAWEMELIQGQQDRPLGSFLLDLLLRQMSTEEQRALIFLAVPRAFDARILRALLHEESDISARQRLARYQRLTFLSQRARDRRLVLHPLIRSLLLHQLPPDRESDADYTRLHTQLHACFAQRAAQGEPWDAVEAAYHALALGDPTAAIQLGKVGQQQDLALWEALLEGVAEAPTALLCEDIEQQAYQALLQAEQQHGAEAAVTAVVLYQWICGKEQANAERAAAAQHNLGIAHRNLPGGDRTANLSRAIACYELALRVYSRETFPIEWAGTQNNLGIAYRELPAGNREANVRQAIACYERALLVHSRETFPTRWAATQQNLGNAYRELPAGDRATHLTRAIACYELALQVYSREALPVEWARTQNNLGNAYRELPGNQAANIHQAIACFQLAAQVYSREAFPVDWARTQNSLGVAYRKLPDGDREANVRQAIAYYEGALLVLTREAFPVDWARTQNNLGVAYRELPTGDHAAHLSQALTCYELALVVFTRETFPAEWARTRQNLDDARKLLQDI